jgi:hypothetical protein
MKQSAALIVALAFAAIPIARGAGMQGDSRSSLYGEVYGADNELTRDMEITSVTAEYEYRLPQPALRPFSFAAISSLYHAAGSSRSDSTTDAAVFDASADGLSVGFIARFFMLETARVAWFNEISGSLVWWTEPFPPQGTSRNGILRVGTGLNVRVTDQWAVIAGARWLHNSNGGGYAADNPAYDGVGAYLGVSGAWSGGHDRPRRNEDAEIGARVAAVLEHFASDQRENGRVDLYAMTSEYEYRLPQHWSWLALTGSFSVYCAEGSRPDPNRGLGEFNAGSVGYGFNLGLRPIWQLGDRWALFADVIGGAQRFTRSFPLRSDQGQFYAPWSMPKSLRYGAGVRWQAVEGSEIVAGYRQLQMDTSPDRPGDAPDYEAHGVFIGFAQRF